MFVYVVNQKHIPLMPTRPAKARLLLRQGKATVVRRTPFTIKLSCGSSGYRQEVVAGMDTGSVTLGTAAIAGAKNAFPPSKGLALSPANAAAVRLRWVTCPGKPPFPVCPSKKAAAAWRPEPPLSFNSKGAAFPPPAEPRGFHAEFLMKPYKFTLPGTFYKALRSKFSEIPKPQMGTDSDKVRGNGVALGKSGPPRTVLEKLIGVALWASLEREEGRNLRFTLCYNMEPYNDKSDVAFNEQFELNVDWIRRVAPALGGTPRSLLVRPEQDNTLRCSHILSTDTYGLTLKVIDPGSIIIGLNGYTCAVIKKGEARLFEKKPENWFGSTLGSIFASNDNEAQAKEFWDFRRLWLVRLLTIIREAGHGGTVVFGTEEVLRNIPGHKINYSLSESPFCEASRLWRYPQKDGDDRAQLDAALEKCLQTCERISRFAMVDGALILTPKLEVMGFGVRLVSEDTGDFPFSNIDLIDDGKSEKRWSEAGGTRHQSAARFANKHPGTLAITISADGPVTFFQKVDNRLYAYKNVEFVMENRVDR